MLNQGSSCVNSLSYLVAPRPQYTFNCLLFSISIYMYVHCIICGLIKDLIWFDFDLNFLLWHATRYIFNLLKTVNVRLGREGQEAMNPVGNLRTLWNGLRTPWKVSEPRGGGFLKKTLSNINITCKLAIIFQSSRHMDSINIIIKLKK